MRMLVVGATGVLGRHVIPRLLERGHRVRALVRRQEQAPALERSGIDAALGDILDAPSLATAARGCEAALHLATAIPRPGGAGDWSANDRVRREGTQNLLAAAAEQGVRVYLQQSIAMLYGDTGGRLATEDFPLQPSPVIASAAEMEALVRGSPLAWTILRGGLFYGPGTGADEGWRQAARAGTLQVPGDGTRYLSLVHVADMARALVAALEKAPAGSVYNVVDDEPVTGLDLYRYVAAQLGAPEPPLGGAERLPSFRCSNQRLKAELGWEPAYPSYRSGLAL